MDNQIATAADFRKLAEQDAFEAPERVVLPKSGLPVILRKPRPIAFSLANHALPSSLTAKSRGDEAPELSKDDRIRMLKFWADMFSMIFLRPRLSLTPGPDEISPNWIPDEDQVFLIRWAVGEVASDGSDLGSFRRATTGVAPAGTNGGAVALPSEQTALGQDEPLSD